MLRFFTFCKSGYPHNEGWMYLHIIDLCIVSLFRSSKWWRSFREAWESQMGLVGPEWAAAWSVGRRLRSLFQVCDGWGQTTQPVEDAEGQGVLSNILELHLGRLPNGIVKKETHFCLLRVNSLNKMCHFVFGSWSVSGIWVWAQFSQRGFGLNVFLVRDKFGHLHHTAKCCAKQAKAL